MKRVILKTMLFLLLGATINVAVAWAWAFRLASATPIANRFDMLEPESSWSVQIVSNSGAFAVWSMRTWGDKDPFAKPGTIALPDACEGLRTPAQPYRDGDAWMEYRHMQAFGWPALSLVCQGSTHLLLKKDRWIEFSGAGGFLTSKFVRREIGGGSWPLMLAYRPVWLGFSANTLLYAAGIWLLGLMPLAVYRRVFRWRIRTKAGLCGACGYPVGIRPVCTECGKPVTPKDVAPT
ncbi:MAG: hypothetical protein L0Y44_08370 [Phycisphaerales bacterium]|nr:hypothetical protein [Phycisphaerales bacterium]